MSGGQRRAAAPRSCLPARRISFCLRALSALVAASRQEDVYGVVLMCPPTLGDVMLLLLSCVLATQAYTRTSVSGRRQPAQSALRRWGTVGAPPEHWRSLIGACPQAVPQSTSSQVLQRVLALTGPPAHPTLQQASDGVRLRACAAWHARLCGRTEGAPGRAVDDRRRRSAARLWRTWRGGAPTGW